MQWRLVEPLDDDSIYAQFLATNGPGVHHVGVGVASYDDALVELGSRGRDVLLAVAAYNGLTFAYPPRNDELARDHGDLLRSTRRRPEAGPTHPVRPPDAPSVSRAANAAARPSLTHRRALAAHRLEAVAAAA